jgi:hypothetical protein
LIVCIKPTLKSKRNNLFSDPSLSAFKVAKGRNCTYVVYKI